ncbi:MAG: EfeM/EfeO family lipoprotein [Chloroflexota bacterium]
MQKKIVIAWLATGMLALAACAAPTQEAAESVNDTSETAVPAGVDLAAVKEYALDNAQQMKTGSAALAATAQSYYDLMAGYGFDYTAAWNADAATLTDLVSQLKDNWLEASTHYELDEGIVAGVPSLSSYDVWIDAGPSAEEDPAEAFEWTLELPDGRTLESPGNFFHSLLEPTIWVTNEDFTGLPVDLDSDGAILLGEGLPEANILLAASTGLDQATGEMIASIEAWEPSMEDAFTALVVMIPTMNEYFEQWKLSSFVAGQDAEDTAFIGTSRLFDINGILNGLDYTYQSISPVVQSAEPELHGQIEAGFTDLRGYVSDLYSQEQNGTVFSAEQVDLFGTEAQGKATSLAGQVSQAAALLDIETAE